MAELSPDTSVDAFNVPGAFELPLLALRLATIDRYDGVTAAAFVVDGGIYRHDFLAQVVVSGLMELQLKTDVPVFSVSLAPQQLSADRRSRGLLQIAFRWERAAIPSTQRIPPSSRRKPSD